MLLVKTMKRICTQIDTIFGSNFHISQTCSQTDYLYCVDILNALDECI